VKPEFFPMSPDEIIAQLARVPRHLPAEALRAAEAHRTELTPRLLACLLEVVAQPQLLEDDPDIQLPFYAMYLLAAWREPGAHPLLLGFLRLPGEQSLELSGDIVTEDMDRMLAQTCGGDPAHIFSLAADPQVNEWARNAAVCALARLVAWGELPRETVLAHYRALIAAAGPPPEDGDGDLILSEIVCCALDLQLTELRDELLALYERGWIDESMVSHREVLDELGQAAPREGKTPLTDVAEAIRWWACFERDLPRRRSSPPPLPAAPPATDATADWDGREEPKPYRAPPKVGRNEPCPCGSGKKYKKCCGQ
jgi:hypothetical protein